MNSINLYSSSYYIKGQSKLGYIINQKRYYNCKLPSNKIIKNNLNYSITDKTVKEVLKELDIQLLYAWDNLEDKKVRKNIINLVKNKTGIYIIINKINNKFYIGSSINNLYLRFCKHLLNLNGNKLLKKSVKLYGLNNFIFGIIELKDNNLINFEELSYLETLYILTLLPQYNILQEAYSNKGYKHNLEIKNSFLKERRNLLIKILANKEWIEENKEKLKLANINKYVLQKTKDKLSLIHSKLIKLYNYQYTSIPDLIIKEDMGMYKDWDKNNEFLCKFKNISLASHYLCTNDKLIWRCLKKGYIYIPNVFIPYLNNNFLSNNNYIKSFINKNNLLFINNINKITQIKSGIIPYLWNTKFYILNK